MNHPTQIIAGTIAGTWSPSKINPPVLSYPAPVHWTMSQLDSIPPPPYHASKEDYYQNYDEETIPTHAETFAKSMFWWGFLFPFFWLAGIFLIFSTLRAPSSWDEEKTREESTRILRLIREAELRWAWRCAYALSTLVVIAILLFLIIKFSIFSG